MSEHGNIFRFRWEFSGAFLIQGEKPGNSQCNAPCTYKQHSLLDYKASYTIGKGLISQATHHDKFGMCPIVQRRLHTATPLLTLALDGADSSVSRSCCMSSC